MFYEWTMFSGIGGVEGGGGGGSPGPEKCPVNVLMKFIKQFIAQMHW